MKCRNPHLNHLNPQVERFFRVIEIQIDLNYFHEINIPSKEPTYLNETDIKTQRFEKVSVLHVNITGLKTNFENFGNLLNNTGTSFNIICLTETWWCSNS